MFLTWLIFQWHGVKKPIDFPPLIHNWWGGYWPVTYLLLPCNCLCPLTASEERKYIKRRNNPLSTVITRNSWTSLSKMRNSMITSLKCASGLLLLSQTMFSLLTCQRPSKCKVFWWLISMKIPGMHHLMSKSSNELGHGVAKKSWESCRGVCKRREGHG